MDNDEQRDYSEEAYNRKLLRDGDGDGPVFAKQLIPRTRKQEQSYVQALGYAWGRKDASEDRKDMVLDSQAYATFHSMVEELGGFHYTFQNSYNYFRMLTLPEQEAYGSQWRRAPHALAGLTD